MTQINLPSSVYVSILGHCNRNEQAMDGAEGVYVRGEWGEEQREDWIAWKWNRKTMIAWWIEFWHHHRGKQIAIY